VQFTVRGDDTAELAKEGSTMDSDALREFLKLQSEEHNGQGTAPAEVLRMFTTEAFRMFEEDLAISHGDDHRSEQSSKVHH
jgi:hypothetical protein